MVSVLVLLDFLMPYNEVHTKVKVCATLNVRKVVSLSCIVHRSFQ